MSKQPDAALEAVVRGWLAEMETCVRAVDYARARHIFAADVVGFGSVNPVLVGLDALERDQWRRVWGTILDFTFLTDQLAWGAAGDPCDLIWIACPWTSQRRTPDGSATPRPGRLTAVLARRDDRWLAVHTHHSTVSRA